MNKQFKDDLNTAVFTTKYVLNKISPIVCVFRHKEDGAWEFCGKENNIPEEDYRIISLAEVIDIDASILEVSDLPLGSMAYRDNKEALWNITKL